MHLEHHEVSPEKDAGDEWVAHPLLLHNYFTCLHFPLDKYPLVGCQGAVAEYPHLLDPRLTRITSYTFSAFSLSQLQLTCMRLIAFYGCGVGDSGVFGGGGGIDIGDGSQLIVEDLVFEFEVGGLQDEVQTRFDDGLPDSNVVEICSSVKPTISVPTGYEGSLVRECQLKSILYYRQ